MLQNKAVELNVFEAILARKSIRNYSSKIVEQNKIGTLLEGAVHAPSALGQEAWAFVIVQDKKLLADISTKAKPHFVDQIKALGRNADLFSDPAFNLFYNASTLIIICGKKEGVFVSADCWLAAENLMLVATAMGLGSCVVGSVLENLQLPEEKERLGIGEEYQAVVPIIVGYPKGEALATKRKKPIVLKKL